MRYRALACDYDGTLATHGKVFPETVAALERLLASGRKLMMVTGRELNDLLAIFPEIGLFEWVVAENGALLYQPGTREEKSLSTPPPAAFIETLRERGVTPMSVGRVIVATWEPHEQTVLAAIRDLGLELQVIFNKGAVMVLPAGMNKASGLAAALKLMELSPHEVAGVGDAENDHALLNLCECGVAVANALPALKERADLVTAADHGAGVAELIGKLVDNDLAEMRGRLPRHHLLLGSRPGGEEVFVSPYGPNLLIAGPSGSGKSTAATCLLDRFVQHQYQFCIIDPEGDYANLKVAIVLGNSTHGPTIDEVLQVLKNPLENSVVNLVGLPLADRPTFFLTLLSRLLEMRVRTGRPHWLLIDEAHHLLPATWKPAELSLPQELTRTIFVTVHPEQVTPAVLSKVGAVLAVGGSPATTLGEFCDAIGIEKPAAADHDLPSGEVLYWPRQAEQPPYVVRLAPSKLERLRHMRKYAEGELPPERSFYFKGPQGKLNLRAQNLHIFLQLADGLDDETWDFHLRRGDYSDWFRQRIKDEALAAEAEDVERNPALSAVESRVQMRKLVEQKYTLPASVPVRLPGTDSDPNEAAGG